MRQIGEYMRIIDWFIQTLATSESTMSYTYDTIGNLNRGQIFAFSESIFSYTYDAVGNDNRGQSIAFNKSLITNAFDTIFSVFIAH